MFPRSASRPAPLGPCCALLAALLPAFALAQAEPPSPRPDPRKASAAPSRGVLRPAVIPPSYVPRPRPDEAPEAGLADAPPDEGEAGPDPTARFASLPFPLSEPETPEAPEPAASDGGAAASDCLQALRGAGIRFSQVAAPAPADARCQPRDPVAIEAIGGDPDVTLRPAATANCAVGLALGAWMKTSVLPAAQEMLGRKPQEVMVGAGYDCRPRNRQPGGKISEHGHANAIDIMGFGFADGASVDVTSGWKDSREGPFLRRIWKEACEHFTTVLGPESDSYHETHLHLDLARRGRKGQSRYCR